MFPAERQPGGGGKMEGKQEVGKLQGANKMEGKGEVAKMEGKFKGSSVKNDFISRKKKPPPLPLPLLRLPPPLPLPLDEGVGGVFCDDSVE